MRFRLPALLLLAACASNPKAPTASRIERPSVPVAEPWPAGTAFATSIRPGLPDELPWRAVATWWREALRQTVSFAMTEPATRGEPVLELQLDPAAHTFAVFRSRDGQSLPLAGGTFVDGALPDAIDRAAWAARLALGEEALPPVPIALGTSADAAVVSGVDDAEALLRDGGVQSSYRVLRDVRRRDGASPFLLDAIASVLLLRGELEAAEKLCLEALGYEVRLTPTTQHRLARSLLLARASLHPDQAKSFDQNLLQLGEVGHRERPFDPEPELSIGIADNFLGDFTAARHSLEAVLPRMPDRAIVAYHLGWACLGGGDAKAAVPQFAEAALHLPAPWVLLPRAIALYESGRQDELATLLQSMLDDPAYADADVAHEILRMQAALALLRGDEALARQRIGADFNWLLAHALVLDRRAGEFAEEGAVLVRLGGWPQLPSLLAAVQQQHNGTAIADACAFIGGMAEAATPPHNLPPAAATLDHGGDSAWTALLTAFTYECRGEIAAMATQAGRAALLSSSPLTKSLLARSLRESGREAEAKQLLDTLRREMRELRLRQPCQHPLLGPELAYAFRG